MKDQDDFSKALSAGTILKNGAYRIEHVLGGGGFGITYLATWIQTQKTGLKEIKTGELTVVVKEFYHKMYCFRDTGSNEILIANEEKQREFNRLKRKLISEARIMNTLIHPNITEVYDAFEENNTAYIVMAYIDGTDLDARVKQQGRIGVSDALKYGIEIARALETVHQHNILHLDISPSNILIDKNNNALLIDFGISLSYNDSGDVILTSKLLTGRKPSFSPPEQSSLEILAKFVPAIDVYALGATLYDCLTGKEPPEASTLASGDAQLKNPSSFYKDIPPALDKIVLKAMSLNRKERYQTATELLADLIKEQRSHNESAIQLLRKEAKKQYQNKEYPSALVLYNKALLLDPENKECLKAKEQCVKAMEENKEQENSLPETQINQDSTAKRKTTDSPSGKTIPFKAHRKIIGICIGVCILFAVIYNILPSVHTEKKEENAPKETPTEQPAPSPETNTTVPSPEVENFKPDYYLDQGNSSYNNSDYDKAIRYYEKYISLSKTDNLSVKKRIEYAKTCSALLKEANSLFSKQEYQKAKALYEKILRIKINDKNARQKIEECEEMITLSNK
ncbi:MAG: protein kinase [Tannerellaceae bacterium]|jgi:serine/threonine protein kinase|nr:protein kinase [Tannerellaceae bacterium]